MTENTTAIVRKLNALGVILVNRSIFTGGASYNVKSYGLVGDGVTDNSAALNTLLNTTAPSGSTIYFPAGTYNFGSNTSVTDKHFNVTGMFATLHATFNGSILTMASSSSTGSLGAKWNFSNLLFTGTSAGNSQTALNFNSFAGHSTILNCSFSAFGASGVGAAVRIAATHFTDCLGATIEGCLFFSNYLGIWIDTRGEYVNITGCDMYSNTNAAIFMSAGNVIINDNNINYNNIGIYAVTGTNNSHSILSNNNINHNTSYSLRLEDQAFGWTISNNHIYQGNVRFKNCNSVNVSGGIFDADNYEYDNNVGGVFSNITFDNAYLNTTTLTSGSLPEYIKCRNLQGLIAASPNTFYASKTTFTSNGTFVVPIGYSIDYITFNNTTANAVTGGIRIGTSAGGAQVVTTQAIGANTIVTLADATLLLKIFSSSATQTLFIEAVTAWNSASVDMYIKLNQLV